jgi:predicted transcriptional regulator
MKKYNKIPYSDDLVEDCLKLIKNNPKITTNEIAEKLNKSPLTISRLISFLRKEGMLPSLKKVMPHAYTPEEEEYPEKEEADREIERLTFENETLRKENEKLKSLIENLTSENSFLKTQLKANADNKKNDLRQELTQYKIKILEYEIKEIEKILNENDNDGMHSYLYSLKSKKKNELRNLENELSKLLS